ncbi:MAG TPA: hypothetical protein VMH26_01635 [Burkholderiales bacterium]|nr:hypothetical protein [Burkholderiales bacterium]
MNWKVLIHGKRSDLEYLARHFQTPKLKIEAESEGYFLSSERFAGMTARDAVREETGRLLAILSGVLGVRRNSRTQLTSEHVILVEPDGSEKVFVNLMDSVNVETEMEAVVVHRDGADVPVQTPSQPTDNLLDLGLRDANVEKALRLFGAGSSDWVGLYRLFEVIEADVGGLSSIVGLGWATNGELRRFKHTANSPGAVGDQARHGSESTLPPKDPMSLADARLLVEQLLRRWLESK